ncbi:MAG: DNA polymerase III subunit alpha, partial [Actinomycetota bacterium]|nr:DNA polymerase III subunit alpha [Actinomycetota bacterium]
HLHVHTEYSPLDGMSHPEDLLDIADQDGQPAVAITDHGTLAGTYAFAEAAKGGPVKPILGMETYLALGPRGGKVSESISEDEDVADPDPEAHGKTSMRTKVVRYEHLTLLAADSVGWSNLVRLNNVAEQTRWAGHGLMDFDLISEHHEGLILLTGCLGGPIARHLARGDGDRAEANLGKMIDAVGAENVFVEMMDHGIPAEQRIIPQLFDLAERFGLKPVVTNDSHYSRAQDADAHDSWLAASTASSKHDPSRFRFNGDGYHFRTAAEMYGTAERYGHDWVNQWRQACENTLLVDEKVQEQVMPEYRLRLPRFDTPDGSDSASYLIGLATDGAKERFGDTLPQPVRERLNTEFKVIRDKGLVDYFLIVHDVINWARGQGILVGPGRGSAAGSLLSYCLGIVNVDPLANGLLFERFLDPERSGMPDIDIDFDSAHGAAVMDYLAQRWGRDRVARLGTLSQTLSRAALQSAGRVLDLRDIGNRLSKMVPVEHGKPTPLGRLLDPKNDGAQEFRDLAATDEGAEVVGLARQFEGVAGTSSIHACGVLISDESVDGIMPLRVEVRKDGTEELVTQWKAGFVEAAGFLKLDVLRLRTLRIIGGCVEQIEAATGEHVDVDSLSMDPSNPRPSAAWDLLRAGRTAGVFQLEKEGIRKLSEQVAPRSLADLSALVALYRPGPLGQGMDQRYAMRKRGEEPVDYTIFTNDPAEQQAIASVLGDTYGAPVYQEQLMRLGTAIAGFDAIGRNKIRKAVSKKNAELMAEVGQQFITGAQQAVTDPTTGQTTKIAFRVETAVRLWDAMKSAGEYSFNKSHAAAYGLMAYITAYLKATWPAQYAAALLAATTDKDRRAAVLGDLAAERVVMLGPSVNLGGVLTNAGADNQVRLGISEIKGMPTAAAEAIIAERTAAGSFSSLNDLARRVSYRGTTKEGAVTEKRLSVSDLETLIDAGALDDLGPRLGLRMIARTARDADIPVPDAHWGPILQARRERELTGVALSSHPLTACIDEVRNFKLDVFDDWGNLVEGSAPTAIHKLPGKDKAHVFTLGVIADWTERAFAWGSMAFFTLEGTRGAITGKVRKWDLEKIKESGMTPRVGDVVAVHGQIAIRKVIVRIADSDSLLDTDDDAGETEVEEERRELTARRFHHVPLSDEPRIPTPVLRRRAQLRVVGSPEPSSSNGGLADAGKPQSPAEVTVDAEVPAIAPLPEIAAPAVARSVDAPASGAAQSPKITCSPTSEDSAGRTLWVIIEKSQRARAAIPYGAKIDDEVTAQWPQFQSTSSQLDQFLHAAPEFSRSRDAVAASGDRLIFAVVDGAWGAPVMAWTAHGDVPAALDEAMSNPKRRRKALQPGDPIVPLPGQLTLFDLPGLPAAEQKDAPDVVNVEHPTETRRSA